MAGRSPATVDIDLIRGDDFSIQFQIVTCDSLTASSGPTDIITEATVIDGVTWEPMDLTGSTVMSQIRKSTQFSESLAVAFTVTVVNPVLGIYNLSLTNTQTTTLAMNDVVKYRYDTQIVTSDGLVTTYVTGAVNVTLDITR